LKRAYQTLAPKFELRDFDRRESINLKEKITFTVLFSLIFGSIGAGIYFVANWAYRLITDLL
jgi:hypothetical protein